MTANSSAIRGVSIPTPGARVVVRDAEWIVRRVDHAPGGYQIICDGVSELVRGREAVFLTALEPTIQVLDPAETKLVPDASAQFTDSILYMESQLRQAVPNDENIHVGHTAAMDLVDYQLDPARLALARPRQRILIADAVGLGKTLEAGILVSELVARGRGRRILVLAVKSMLTQFQKEFWNRFTIPLTRLDSVGIQRVRSRIPANHNPFYYYDKAIISIDTLKQDAEYRVYLEQATWDIIVIDEAHNVADRGTASQRNRLARLLARRSDTLIMLSATPHDGRARSFASLVNMLDATAITNPDDYTKEDFRPGLVIRRFKKDVQEQVREAFKDRKVHPRRFPASAAEEAAFDALLAVRLVGHRPDAPNRDLFTVTLEKALFSSPAACIETVDERIRRREREIENGEDAAPRRAEIANGEDTAPRRAEIANGEDAAPRRAETANGEDVTPRRAETANGEDAAPRRAEIDGLRELRTALERIAPTTWSKYQALLAAIRDGRPFRWQPTDPADRLVIFTERIATLSWLKARLARDLDLEPGQVETLHGGMSDVDQQRVVEDFGNTQRPVRLLICSDVASEGINLHYQCHRLIHFDMPWSLMVFQQRNGRVDRYGQDATPRIVYLVTESANPTIRGDTRILEVLMAKDEQAYRNIGDPSVFMDVHDIDEEEAITRRAVARGESDVDFDRRLTPEPSDGESLLAMFLQPEGDQATTRPTTEPPRPLSLFASELDYCEAAVRRLQAARAETRAENGGAGGPFAVSARLRLVVDRDAETLILDAPEDLVTRYGYLPPEVLPDSHRFVLTTSRDRMTEAIAESRRAESAWPRMHYLWRLSPVVGWLNDRILAVFGRSEAPVLAGVPGLERDEAVFVFSGLVSNRKSHPLVYEWIAFSFRGAEFSQSIPFEALIERTGMRYRTTPNLQQPTDTAALSRLLPGAVSRARAHFIERRAAFEAIVDAKLEDEVRALDEFRDRHLRQLELDFSESGQQEHFRRRRYEQDRQEVEAVHDEYWTWISETMTPETHPWIKVVCAMTAHAP